MVDRIVPRTTDKMLNFVKENYGIDDLSPVTGEEFIQWVIDDNFAHEKPKWDAFGPEVIYVKRCCALMK